jgi:penicillin-binding protein 1C
LINNLKKLRLTLLNSTVFDGLTGARPALAIIAALFLTLRLFPHGSLADAVGTSRAVYASDGSLMRLTLAPDEQYRLWTPLAQIAPALVDGVLLYEDRYFYWHIGVNPLALVRSAWSSAAGERLLGGSTLTMQLARRVYGINSRSLSGKLHQVAAAVWLEARYSKHELLEAYLNTAPYGGNIEGVGAASLIYFRKNAAQLTLPEALTLAVIPQNPIKRTAERGNNAPLAAARARLWALWAAHSPSTARYASEVSLTLDTQGRSQLPFLAPHTTERVLALYPEQREIVTTLDARMQRVVERVTAQYLREKAGVGLNNASALLLDAQTMQVRAVVGSADFKSEVISGQVNATLAKRSPGSTLKPFIYALALDQGLLHPKTVLKDAPRSFGPFSPENFDGRFAGPLPAQDALIRSRNVPAVAVAAKLSKPSLYDFMKLAGVSRLQSEQHYGLALVLGGGEVTMEELATMYAVLANGGQYSPLQYVQATQTRQSTNRVANRDANRDANRIADPPSLRLLSEEASFIALDMLQQTPRPDTSSPARPAIAWKTGTSWGFRDAWTAGVFGRYVLVVWAGNFDGTSNPALVGVEAAAPLFLRIVDALRAERLELAAVATVLPPQLRKIEVCAATGGLPDALCPVLTQSWFIAGRSPITTSQLHRKVWLDPATGKIVCPAAGGDTSKLRALVVEDWGSDMQKLFSQAGLGRRNGAGVGVGTKRNAAAPCDSVVTNDNGAMDGQALSQLNAAAPVITSPLRGVTYVLRTNKPDPIVLRAEAAAGVTTLYWFANDSLLGKTKPSIGLAWTPPAEGDYALRVVDDQGNAQSRSLKVELAP